MTEASADGVESLVELSPEDVTAPVSLMDSVDAKVDSTRVSDAADGFGSRAYSV